MTFPGQPVGGPGTFPECLRQMTEGMAQMISAMEALQGLMPVSTVELTDSNGRVTWNYDGREFDDPPCIQNAVLANTANVYNIREISRSATQIVLQVIQATASVSLSPILALNVGGAYANAGAGIAVSITAHQAS